MKTISSILLAALLLLLCFACAAEELPVQYTAKANVEFHLREKPDGKRWVCDVPKHKRVEVLNLGDEWTLMRYQGKEGYGKTKWLREYISADPYKYPVPGFIPCTGMWTFSEETRITADQFPGLTVPAGTAVSVYADMQLPVWRTVTPTEGMAGTYTPFAFWDEAEPGDLIAGFTTYYDVKMGAPKAPERRHNIEVGCALMDGMVMQPGDIFSFNTVCGPYNRTRDYKLARNVSDTGYGYGGGVCQLSTTLYNALLEVPLRITDWEVHSISGMKYAPVSRDACVGAYTDLCFENSLPYPILLEAQPQGGALTVLIRRGAE